MTPQSAIAHYRITSKLGEGGMGAVYRATDTKLGREVAVKVLPESLAADPDRLARFAREAQVLASLNHPNIAAIYGVEDRALIMELVEGAAPAGPLDADEVLAIVYQLVDALEYAHEKGIVHRDLKPANLKVTPDGRLKVLDFGLAKALACDPDRPAADPANSPTMTMSATSTGVIMGTAAYMSPEQARGQAVDKRADIWSFGVVVYELLTGKPLFGGDSLSDTLAAVLRHEPDFSAVPPRFQRLLRLCLTRDPRQRLRDISGARLLLDEAQVADHAPQRRWPWIAALGATAALAAVGWWPPSKPAEITRVHFTIPLPAGTVQSPNLAAPEVAPSPDGRNLAFIVRDARGEKTGLWVRPLNSTAARRLDRTDGADHPFWSPDSQHIGFFADQKLKRVAIDRGTAQTICAVEAGNNGASWGEDGSIVFSQGRSGLSRVAATGGTPAPVTTRDEKAGESRHVWPQWLPGGRRVLYLAAAQNDNEGTIYVQEVGSSARTRVMGNFSRAVLGDANHLLFVREETLLAQRFDLKTLKLEGEPVALAEGLMENAVNGRTPFQASAGVLAYRSGSAAYAHQLVWRDRNGRELGKLGDTMEIHGVMLSPEGKQAIVLRHGRMFKDEIWLMDTATGVMMRPPFGEGRSSSRLNAIWSPDGKRMALSSQGSGLTLLTLATGEKVTIPGNDLSAEAWTPDGRYLLCLEKQSRLLLVPVSPGGERKTISESPYVQFMFRFSPDGRRIAFVSNESGALELYVADYPSFNGKRRISTGGALFPAWSPDGKTLAFENGGKLMIADMTRAGGVPQESFGGLSRIANFAIAPDGRFLLAEIPPAKDDPTFHVVLNWAAGLKP